MAVHGGNLREATERYRLKGKKIIDFSANINPLGFTQGAHKIILAKLKDVSDYPDPDCKVLKETLSKYLNIAQDNLLIGNGSMELIFLLALALRPKKALIPIPSFSEYESAVRLAGGRPLFLETHEDDDFKINVTEIVKRLTRVDMVFISNPNNPTGFLFDKEAMWFLVAQCQKKGVFLVIDEVFMDFVKEKNELSLNKVATRKSHILILQSLTKFFALAGLRLGYLVGSKSLLKRISDYQPPWSVNSLAQLAGCAVIKDTFYQKKSRKYIFQEREFLFRELKKIKFISPYPPTANFIFSKLQSNRINSRKLCDYCANKGMLLRDCSNFRGLDNRFIRIAVRNRDENKKLIKALKDIPKL